MKLTPFAFYTWSRLKVSILTICVIGKRQGVQNLKTGIQCKSIVLSMRSSWIMNRTNSVNVGEAAKSAALLTYRHLCFISCNEEVTMVMASLTRSTWCHLLHTVELHFKIWMFYWLTFVNKCYTLLVKWPVLLPHWRSSKFEYSKRWDNALIFQKLQLESRQVKTI